jgi:hypothetical protein
MKKTRSRKSRDTVPLKGLSPQIQNVGSLPSKRLMDAKFAGVNGCPPFSKALLFVCSRHANCKRVAANRIQTVLVAATTLLLKLHADAAIREPSTRLAVSLLCFNKIILNIYVP